MANLENSHPDMFNHMLNQGFTVSLSRQSFTNIKYRVIKLLKWLSVVRQKTLEDCQEKQSEGCMQVNVGCELTNGSFEIEIDTKKII